MIISGKGQRHIEKYLARVRRALADHEPTERREIIEGLRAHIRDELASRTTHSPSLEDIHAVLSTMDAPQSFGQQDEIEVSLQVGRSRMLGRLGFAIWLGAIALFGLSLLLGATVADSFYRGGLMVSGMLAVCALGLGIAGWRDPFGKAAVIGAALALIAALLVIPVHQTPTGPASPAPIIEEVGESAD